MGNQTACVSMLPKSSLGLGQLRRPTGMAYEEVSCFPSLSPLNLSSTFLVYRRFLLQLHFLYNLTTIWLFTRILNTLRLYYLSVFSWRDLFFSCYFNNSFFQIWRSLKEKEMWIWPRFFSCYFDNSFCRGFNGIEFFNLILN